MTEAQTKNDSFSITSKREIDWAQYLDFTLFIESEENDDLEKFKNDFIYNDINNFASFKSFSFISPGYHTLK